MTYIIISFFFWQLDRIDIGYAQLTMGKDLHLSGALFGLAAGVFSISALLMQFPAAICFEKFGARRWMTFCVLGWGTVSIGLAFVQTSTQLVVLRVLLGVFEAGCQLGMWLVIAIWFRGNKHGMANSWIQIGFALGGMIGGPYAGWILGHSLLGLVGWRSLFFVDGSITVIWGILALLIIYDGPEKARWLKPDERQFIIKYLADYQAQKAAEGALEKSSFWETFKDARIICLIFAFFFAAWTTGTVVFFMPSLLKTAGQGISNQHVGLLSVGVFVIQGVVAFTWGKHADRTEPTRHWHCVMPLLVGVTGVLLFLVAKTPVVAMIAMALWTAGNCGFFVTFWPTCHMLVGKETIGKAIALINAGSLLGNFLAPIFFGWARDITGNTKVGLYVIIGVLLVNFTMMNIFFFRYKVQLSKRQKEKAIAAATS